KHSTKRPLTPGQVQALFLFAIGPKAIEWPVRQIAIQAGISKSKAAQVREEIKRKYEHWPPTELRQILLSGYSEMLRPKIFLGRYRSPEARVEEFLARLRRDLASLDLRYALTGGPAAEQLQHFYHGSEISIFLSDGNPEIQKKLRLLPDRNGPITFLHGFGE